jgi:hypothetical protein
MAQVKVRHDAAPQQDHQRRTAWEYAAVPGNGGDVRLLAEYGAEGWELVCVAPEFGARVMYYFKRRKP